MVEAGSVVRDKDALTVRFSVTDTAQTIPVVYTGILPDLFKEGKGVVAQGASGRRHLQGERGARQARRELHAARGRDALKKAGQPATRRLRRTERRQR
jgi:cytochrome c-type biogenesis protein CcmE